MKPNPRAAFRWFQRSAELGSASGQVSLGNYFAAGRLTKRDNDKAIFWYKRAVRQGAAHGAVNIASVYDHRKNHRRAFFWYRRAAEMRDGDALVEVGIRYYTGRGVVRDSKRAVASFRNVIQRGNGFTSQSGRELAMYWLGRAYREGLGVARSDTKAMAWLSKANCDDDLPAAGRLLRDIKATL